MNGRLLALLACSWASYGCEPTVLDFYPPTGVAGAAHAPPQAPEVAELIVEGRLDLGATNTGERKCADGGDVVSYPVAALTADHADLARAPSTGCLEVGDELLLIKLQGEADSTTNVGQHELLRVDSMNNRQIAFVSSKIRHYGTSPNQDDHIERGVVLLQRVPSYSRLEVRAGAVLTTSPWNGRSGGVLTVRVLGDTLLDGTIDLGAAGFRGAPAPEAALAHGLQGESLAGLGQALQIAATGGGGGGLGDQTRQGCVQDGNAGGGGGHREAGAAARVLDLCDGVGAGQGGVAYAKAGLLFLGSGGGSGGVDNVRADNPPGGAGGNGGGIVWLLSQSLTGSGAILANGSAGVGDELGLECSGGSTTSCYDHSGPGGGGAGGSIRVNAAVVRGVELTVNGGRGGNGNDMSSGDGGSGAPGVIE